jgi:hypothetical protein
LESTRYVKAKMNVAIEKIAFRFGDKGTFGNPLRAAKQ